MQCIMMYDLPLMHCTETGEPEQFLFIVSVHPSKLPGGGCEGQFMSVIYGEMPYKLLGFESIRDPAKGEKFNT